MRIAIVVLLGVLVVLEVGNRVQQRMLQGVAESIEEKCAMLDELKHLKHIERLVKDVEDKHQVPHRPTGQVGDLPPKN